MRNQRERREVDGPLFHRRIADVGQIAKQVEGNSIGPRYFFHGIAPGGYQLGVLVVDRVALLVKSVRHDHGFECLVGSAVGFVPLLLEPLKRLGLVGLIGFDVGAARGPIPEECGRVQFRGPRQGDSVLRQGCRHIPGHAVAREPPQVEDLILPVERRSRLAFLGVLILEFAVLQPDDLHAAGMERDQLVHGPAAAGLDQAVAVAPEEQLAHHPLPPLKTRHPVVRLVGEHFLEWLVFGDLFAAAGESAVEVEWHRRY